jgi:formylglycine-generating enzyme required for sulfatase activity
MKPTRSIPYLFSAALLCSVPPQCVAQAPPGLSIGTYAGLTITGAVGTVYTVQYNTNLAQPDGWQGAGIVQLPSSPYVWVDTAAPLAGQRFYRAVEGPTSLAWIPPGTFTMGSPSNEAERQDAEGPQTVVTLPSGFFMGKYPVTQGEYLAVMGSNPSYFRNGTDGTNSGGTGNTITNESRHPVEMVSWNDAVNYCASLTAQEQSAGRLPGGWLYRLPTEAEWEYACRGGTTTAFHDGSALRSGMANFDGLYEYDASLGTTNNSGGIFLGRTTVVGSYEANGWGLSDMHGNVREWCADLWDGSSLPGGRVVDPQGRITALARMVRGGSWHDVAGNCRSAVRLNYGFPDERYFDSGFRVVLASGNACLNNNGGCFPGQICSMSSRGRICSGNSCGVVRCQGSGECGVCGGVCIRPFSSPIGSPGYCNNDPPRHAQTCDFAVGCNNDSECQTLCGGVCIPPDYSGGGSYGHCDNTY